MNHSGVGMNRSSLACLLLALSSTWALAQDEDAAEKELKELKEKTVLSDDPWTSARAAGLGGALSGLADGIDAPYYNPAGIGGLHKDKKESGDFLRILYFPFPLLGAAINDNSVALFSQFKSRENATTDPVITKAVLDANAGKRQYARNSVVPAFNMSRFFLGYVLDNQIAAVPYSDGSGLIQTHQRVSSGPAAGFSATDPNDTLYIGAFATSLSRTEIEGDLAFGDFVDPELRKTALSQNTKHYSGTASTAGMIWRITPKAGNPKLSMVARNIGDTTYKSSDGGEPVVVKEDLSMAFTLSPRLGKWGYFSWTIEGSKLTDPATAVAKKAKTGLELTFGSLFGSSSIFGLRAGGNSAGASFGAHLNFGLLGFQAASYAEDIGTDNNRVIERRYLAMFGINVAH